MGAVQDGATERSRVALQEGVPLMRRCPSPRPSWCPSLTLYLSKRVHVSQSFYTYVRELLPNDALTFPKEVHGKDWATPGHWDTKYALLREMGEAVTI